MTATQLFERLATTMMVTAYGEGSTQLQSPPPKAKNPVLASVMEMETVHDATAPGNANAGHQLMELPTVLLEHACSFLDHASLHNVETTSVAMYNITKQSDLWMQLALQHVVVGDESCRQHSWKQMMCLASGSCRDGNELIQGVKAFSSADRSSETPENTIKPSQCWREINRFKRRDSLNNLQEIYDVPTFVMTLGERIQMRCGCSSGNSCYWSSSASTDKNAADYIDYVLDGPCVISSVQILPYRVFWHPGSPTYGPQHMMVEFYERTANDTRMANPRGEMVANASAVSPFYQSPVFPVKNDMELQEFQLPVRVWTSGSTIMRVRLLGRHQAQTFELPLWMQRTDEDRLPKYYCCLSYVNAIGLSHGTLLSPEEVLPSRKRMKVASPGSSIPTSLADIMAACFDTMMEQRRRVQLLGSPSG